MNSEATWLASTNLTNQAIQALRRNNQDLSYSTTNNHLIQQNLNIEKKLRKMLEPEKKYSYELAWRH